MPTANSVFVDTSGWAEPLMGNSPDHIRMEGYYRQLIATKRPLVTTKYIFAELVALLTTRSRFDRAATVKIVNQIKYIRQLQIIHIDTAQDADAWAMLERYTDKQWSLVDAASFVIMRQLGIVEAFTTDHHFAQAGFVAVPA